MVLNIQRTINELKQKVNQNIGQIKNNQTLIKKIIKESDIQKHEKRYYTFNARNKELINQNNDLINVQLTLVKFLEKYKDTAILDENIPLVDIYSITDEQEVFALTTKNVVTFDEAHPYYLNQNFIEKLILHYEFTEDYEQCQKLITLKKELA